MTPRFNKIPAELRDRPQWVCWRWGAPGHRIGSRNRCLLSEVRAWPAAGGPKR